MRSVSKRLAVLSLLVVLAAQGAAGAPRDDGGRGQDRTFGGHIKHLIVRILDQLGWPKP